MFNKIKYLFIIILLVCFILPSQAVEDVVVQEQSTNYTGLDDYTGENYFKSFSELYKGRVDKKEELKQQHNSQFKEESARYGFYDKKHTIPPLKKIRKKLVKKYDKYKAKVQANKVKKQKLKQQKFDSNGMPIEGDTDDEMTSEVSKENDIDKDANSSVAEEENEVETEEQQVAKTQMSIRCRTMKYLPESNEIEAIGNIEINFPEQGTQLYADRMTYNQTTDVIQLFDNVKINQGGMEVTGDYFKYDMNEESSLIDNMKASEYDVDIYAENGYMFGDTIIAENGNVKTNKDMLIEMLPSETFGRGIRSMNIPIDDKEFLISEERNSNLVVKVNELKVSAKKSHDTVQLKQPKIYNKNGKKLLALPSMTLYTNKQHDYFEANYPEIGSRSNFGMFAGPSVVLELPFGSVLKVAPTINYDRKLGFGGFGRFVSGTNTTELAYNTAANMFTMRGYQALDDNLHAQYGYNTYLRNGILGDSWVGAAGELVYTKAFRHDDFLYKGADLTFDNLVSAGFIKENRDTRSGKEYPKYHNQSTFRTEYQGRITQTVYSLFTDDDDSTKYNEGWKKLKLNLIGQTSVGLYGTGDTQIVGQLGPQIDMQYKKWRQTFGYNVTATSGQSPLTYSDNYRYGSSYVYLREYLQLHKYLSVGLFANYMLGGDKYDYIRDKESALREAKIYVGLGPDDFKLDVGYDFIRQNAYIGMSMAMNPKGSTLDFNKMEIKNPKDLGTDEEKNERRFEDNFYVPLSPYKTRAVVTELEDASTIMKGENQ